VNGDMCAVWNVSGIGFGVCWLLLIVAVGHIYRERRSMGRKWECIERVLYGFL